MSHREVRAGCRKRQDLRHKLILGSIGGVLWGSQARDRMPNLNQMNGILVIPTGVLSKGLISIQVLRGWGNS